MSSESNAEQEDKPSRAFLPYPTSTLSPRIVPNDLTSFKSRGISQVERDLEQKLIEIREAYSAAVDHFNWNKLVYEAELNFEPVVGRTYHLYHLSRGYTLSMIPPEQWFQPFIGTFRLNVDRQWEPVKISEEVDTQTFFNAS